jgi:hypothetical protein
VVDTVVVVTTAPSVPDRVNSAVSATLEAIAARKKEIQSVSNPDYREYNRLLGIEKAVKGHHQPLGALRNLIQKAAKSEHPDVDMLLTHDIDLEVWFVVVSTRVSLGGLWDTICQGADGLREQHRTFKFFLLSETSHQLKLSWP